MMWSDLNHFSKLFRCCVVWPCVTKNSSITDRSWTAMLLLLVNVYSAYLSPPGTNSDVMCLIRVKLFCLRWQMRRHEEAHHGCPTHLSHTLADHNCTSLVQKYNQSARQKQDLLIRSKQIMTSSLTGRLRYYKTVLLYPQALN